VTDTHGRSIRPALTWTATGVAFTAAIAAHIVTTGSAMDVTGPLLLLDHLFDLFAVTAVFTICFGVGRFLLRWYRPGFQDPIDVLVFAISSGGAVVGVGNLAIGALGGFHPIILWLVLVVTALATRRHLAEIPALLRRVTDTIGRARKESHLVDLGLVVSGVAAAFMLVNALTPPVDWDSLMYHLQVPAQFLETGRVHLPVDNLHVALVGLPHMLYAPLIGVHSVAGPALASAAFAILLGLATFRVAARFFGAAAAGASLALLWGSSTILLVGITPRVDVTLALYTFLAHYALLIAVEDRHRASYYLAAALLGCAFGVKYHAGLYLIGLAPLIVGCARPFTKKRAALLHLVAFGLVFVITAGPWILKNVALLGAPFYPFLTPIRLEPWLAGFFGSTGVPEGASAAIFAILSEVRVPFNVWDAFFAPSRLTVELEGAFYYASPALLIVPLWLALLRHRWLTWFVVPALLYLLVLILPFPATNLRYLIPAIIPLTIVAGQLAASLASRLAPQHVHGPALTILILLSLIPSARTAYTWLTRTIALSHAAGVTSRSEYLASHFDAGVQVYAPVVEFVNDSIPDESRVLMLFEARGYYFAPHVLQDNRVTNWPLLATTVADDACLDTDAFTHVLLATGSMAYYQQRGLAADVVQEAKLQDYARRCWQLIYQGPGFVAFEAGAAER
jgi:hypothetical protein